MELDHPQVPGIGPSPLPSGRLREERTPRDAALSREAARALEADLRRALEGEVRFDEGSRAAYATDGSNYRQVPIGVVVPRSVDEVVAAIAVCRAHGAPVLSRGGGTSLAGQCCNVAVVLDHSKHVNGRHALDPDRRTALVEPGLVLDRLRGAAERHGLTFGPDPSTHDHCTLGGMIGNDSCGTHSVLAGRTTENVHRLEILTYDGERMWVGPTSDAERAAIAEAGGRRGRIYRDLAALRGRFAERIRTGYPHIPRRVSGYSLDQLLPEHGFHVARALVGSEGTLVTVLRAELRLVPNPPARALLVLGYPDVFAAGDDVPELLRTGVIGLEGMDDVLVRDVRVKHLHPERLAILPEGHGWLFAEFGGSDAREAEAAAARCMDALRRGPHPPALRLLRDPREQELAWKVRESGLGATAWVPGQADTWEGWEDSAVPPARLGEYLRALRELYGRYGYHGALYGHFGQGCVHTRVDFDLRTREGVARYRAFVQEAADLVVSLGGSLSGEHGDGQSRGELLVRMFGPELVDAFRAFKRIWDPAGKMNPGKVVDAYPLDRNLRLGPGYRDARPRVHFRLPEDEGSFGRAALRCVGIGECRRDAGGVMCPSYRVTREEVHSTRGRARLLHEMMVGDPLRGGWRSRAVKEALDLCLSCKGCKSDCPVNVDMATYKAEFLAHHYHRRLRPPAAYAMGLVMYWARAAALVPGLVNALGRTPLLSHAGKRLAGLAPQRDLPRFAPVTLQRWWARRPRGPAGKRAILFADTFTDAFQPEVGVAAIDVLERAGWAPELSPPGLCCGRPLYDFGMLDLARAHLRRNLAALRPAVDAGVPIVFLEPSCAAVFRDELENLLHGEPGARELAERTRLLAELVEEAGPSFPVARLSRRAVVQLHCHQHAVFGRDAELAVLGRMGLDVRPLDEGCCGMAGAFGFEAGRKYEVSMAVGERGVLPAVRRAPAQDLLVADGFSCRTQIAQGAGRRALHLAEALRFAQEPGAEAADPAAWAEARRPRRTASDAARELALGAALAGGAIAGLLGAVRGLRGK
jgi:FAD/FMN-containing dehydrogenase/Fe-S oxidoreductase